jgi:hypothetical protein
LGAAKPVAERNIDLLQHQGTETMDYYGGKVTGSMNIPVTGKYMIDLNLKWIPDDTHPEHPNGGGQLKIDSKSLITIDGRKNGRGSVTLDLTAGSHPVELMYYKTFGHWYQRADDIVFSIEGPGIAYSNLNSVLLFAEAVGAITVPTDSEPVMLRSFLNHGGKKKTHVISVAEPSGVSYSYDLQTGTLLQCWRGDFVETTLMWHERGEPQLAEPLGSLIVFEGWPAVAPLSDKNSSWPESSANYIYSGYDIDGGGHPVFKYSIGNINVRETLAATNTQGISHTVTITSPGNVNLWSKIAQGSSITKLPNGLYAVNDKQYYVQLPAKTEVVIRKSGDKGMEMLVPIKTKDNNGSINYNIIW